MLQALHEITNSPSHFTDHQAEVVVHYQAGMVIDQLISLSAKPFNQSINQSINQCIWRRGTMFL